MKTLTLINDIIKNLGRLANSLKTLYSMIKNSFKKEKNVI